MKDPCRHCDVLIPDVTLSHEYFAFQTNYRYFRADIKLLNV